MGGQVVRSEIGLELDHSSAQAPASDLADEDLAEEIAGYREGVAGKETEGKDAFDASSFPSRAAWRARF